MSDPVSNAEIEDVLSSIRRLIAAGDPNQKDEAPASTAADDKLILTPAFRVFGGDPEKTVQDPAHPETAHPATGRDIPVESLEQDTPTPAEPADAAKDADDGPLVLTFDTNMAEPGFQSMSDMSMPPADTQVDFEDNWDSDALAETAQVAFLHQRVTSVAAHTPPDEEAPKVATEEAAEPEVMAEEEPLAGEAEMAATGAEAPVVDEAAGAEPELVAAPEAEEVPEIEAVAEVDEVLEQASDQVEIDQDTTAVEELEIVEEEPVLTDSDIPAEGEVEDQPILAEVEVLADEPVEDVLGTQVLTAAMDEAPVSEIVEDDSDFIDEEHLQEIVSRIVREELKGEMGVKITQAVRRMVRREVTRALSLEKFD
ncbi:hypothetical protein [uncultured Aliiroseovarius sp.]|uniref:hypothetical protein n=1 Tax=uncultured Aliiroseovarius sp. TaxID=1658783 RepID=UPI002632E8E9|nr:hypothetical protein [uncultured Aliiroseovarius sp.]